MIVPSLRPAVALAARPMTSQPEPPRTRHGRRSGRRRWREGFPPDLMFVLATVLCLTVAGATTALDGLPDALRDTLGAAMDMLADS